jgi:hypothetical protein
MAMGDWALIDGIDELCMGVLGAVLWYGYGELVLFRDG